MAVAGNRSISIAFTGDIVWSQNFDAAENADSPGVIEVKTMAAGLNTITPPAGVTAKACTIIMPTGNVETLTLKGVTGDTGVVLHPTDPTTIALNSSSATFALTASAEITDVRLIWT